MARILILGGGSRGLLLAGELRGDGHAVRIVTRRDTRRPEIEGVGGECFVGDPSRLVTLRPALEHVAVVCWLLATAEGERETIEALHGSRLAQFLRSLIDTTVRGVIYEGGGAQLPHGLLSQGERVVRDAGRASSIPVQVLHADPRDSGEWLREARGAVRLLLHHRRGALSSSS